jgi:hypothetical protein
MKINKRKNIEKNRISIEIFNVDSLAENFENHE